MSISRFGRQFLKSKQGEVKEKKHKYGAKSVRHDGLSFASKLEAAVYDILLLLQRAGDIQNLSTQKRVYLVRNPDIYYVPDFYFERGGLPMYAEAKGFETPEWKIKKKLWQHFGPTPLEIFQGSYKSPKLVETLRPKNEWVRLAGTK